VRTYDKPVYSIDEVAEITRFKKRQLIEDCRAGRIEHIYRDRAHWMTPEQIEALFKQHTRKPVARPRVEAADPDELDRRRAARRTGRRAA